jgi:hypothetical protein
MTTHEETIQVPDGWTVDYLCFSDADMKQPYIRLKPIEPAIKPCAYCGAEWETSIYERRPQCFLYAKHKPGCICVNGMVFPTRLAAIEAANRRAT